MKNLVLAVGLLFLACGGEEKVAAPDAPEATEVRISGSRIAGYDGETEVWLRSVDGVIASHVMAEVGGEPVVIIGVGNSSLHSDTGRIIAIKTRDGLSALSFDLNSVRRPEFVERFDRFRVDAMAIAGDTLVVIASDVTYYASMMAVFDIENGLTMGRFWNPGTLQHLLMYVADDRLKVAAAGYNNDITQFIGGEAPAAAFFQLDVGSMEGKETQAPPSLMSDVMQTGSDWYYVVPGTSVTGIRISQRELLVEPGNIVVETPCGSLGNFPMSCITIVDPEGQVLSASPDVQLHKIDNNAG